MSRYLPFLILVRDLPATLCYNRIYATQTKDQPAHRRETSTSRRQYLCPV